MTYDDSPHATTPGAGGALVGRKAELDTARRILAEQRLLTITGPSGVGKSRLARRLAAEPGRESLWIDLGAAPPPAGLPDPPERGVIILDDADRADGVEALVARILAESPEAVVVVTSTTVLGCAGEHLLELQPLRYPACGPASPRAFLEWDAPRLLVDRIRALDPEFTVTTTAVSVLRDICACCDGLPALLELAASATRVLSLEAVRDALRSVDSLVDLLPGGRTLAERSAQVLAVCDDAELDLLGMASLLREPITLDCLTGLLTEAGDGPGEARATGRPELVAAFCRLVDRSLLVRDPEVEGAFRLTRTVASHGRRHLERSGRAPASRARIEAHLLALLDAFAGSTGGPGEAQLARHLLDHRRSIQELLSRRAADPATAETAIRLVVRLRRQWSALGLVPHAQAWLEQAIAVRPERDALTAEALRVSAFFSILGSDVGRSERLLAESLALASAPDERSAVSTAFVRALVHLGELRLHDAASLLDEVIERTRLLGQVELLPEQQYFRSLVAVIHGDDERAEQNFRASLAWMRARGNRWGIAHALIPVTISLLNRRLDERAGETAREALTMMESLGDSVGLPTCLRLLAVLAVRGGDYARAAVLLAGANRLDDTWTMTREIIGTDVERDVRRALDARQFARLSEKGRRLDRRALVRLALEPASAQRAARPAVLTRREAEIAELLVDGLSSAQIATQLVLSTRTVEGHIRRMLHKLGFRSRSQIAVWMSDRLEVDRLPLSG